MVVRSYRHTTASLDGFAVLVYCVYNPPGIGQLANGIYLSLCGGVVACMCVYMCVSVSVSKEKDMYNMTKGGAAAERLTFQSIHPRK